MNCKKPSISVIMPVYNGESYLSEAIESILTQTMSDFEFLILDDGSTDKSLSIIRHYEKQDARIKVISRENQGLVKSLNEGIKKSRGTYIARMDADDISKPERFFKEVELLEKDAELMLVGTNFENIYTGLISNETRKRKKRFEQNVNLPIFGAEYRILHPTWMIRKALFDKIGMYDSYYAEDVEFLFRTVWSGYKIAKVEEKLFQYRILEESKSAIEGKTEENKRQIISFKMKYLVSYLGNRMTTLHYAIWGADISGKLFFEYMLENFPNSKCETFIDGKKQGQFLDTPIISPEHMKKYGFVFICTNGGAEMAFQYMKQAGMQEKEEYFKVV